MLFRFRDLIFFNKPWLFKKQIQDEIFGRMWFNEDTKQPQHNHYQGHLVFKPTGRGIDIYFDSESDGFSLDQKSIFKNLEKNYVDFVSKLLPPMQEYICKKKGQDIVIKDFSSEFQLFAISISKIKDRQKEVGLSFLSETHSIPNIAVTFVNQEVVKIA